MTDKLLKTQIHDSILEDIINGVYSPNYIFNEKTLIEKYQMSKSPIRDALIELCNEGVLRSIPRYGYEIVKITEKQVRELTELRVLIECDGLRKLCKYIDNNYIRILKDCIDKNSIMIPALNDNIWELWNMNIKFHKLLYSFSNNEYIESVLEDSLNTLTRAYSQLYWNRFKTYIAYGSECYHGKVVRCLEEKDYEGAIKFLKKDILSFDFVDER